MSFSTNLSQIEINTVLVTMRSHTHDHVISNLDLLILYQQENRSKRKTSAITLLQVKTNFTTSAELTKTILFNRKIFRKNSPKTACISLKLAQTTATRNSKKNPATQQQNQPNCAGKPPNWQHWALVTCGKRLLRKLEENIWRFIAVLLLRHKDQQYNNPLANFAISLCISASVATRREKSLR